MSWRVVAIRRQAKLDLKLGQMVVRSEETVRINLSEIAVLIIENTAVSLTACLLSELMARKIKVIFCDEKRSPQGELLPYYGSHDSSARIRAQLAWKALDKEWVWTEIVRAKITRQAELLRACGLQQEGVLRGYLEQLQPGDASNREGHAAKVYFNALFGLQFTRSLDCPVNAALNYGYSILLSAFNREIAISGYLTQLGLFHDNTFNPFNLASDLMEPFRPLADREVFRMQPQQFGKDEKLQMANVLNHEVEIAGKRQYVLNAIRIYCNGIFDALNESDYGRLRFYEV